METSWSQVKSALEAKIPPNAYKIWIGPIRYVDMEDGRVVLGCPNKFFVNWVRENYLSLIEEELGRAAGFSVRVRFEVTEELDTRKKACSEESESSAPKSRQLSLPAIFEPMHLFRTLNPAFTFDQFVTGENNQFAFSTAWNLSRGKNDHVNFVYYLSGPGLGKSHLCQAIGRDILGREPKRRLLYLTVEDFINEMIVSLKEKRMNAFKEKYRSSCDVLLLEGIHFLSGKEKTQDEFAFTLDSLLNLNKKVVLTSNKLPKDIRNIQGNLRSRLNSGLIAQIDPPDFDTRVRILEKKAESFNINTPKRVVEFLAEHIENDVRQLESSLISLDAISSLENRPINVELAENVVQRFVEHKKHLDLETIQGFVAEHFKVTVEEMTSKSRQNRIVFPRSIAIHLCRRYTDFTLESIGKAFRRNHPSVLYALKSLKSKMKKDKKIDKQVKLLEGKMERMLFMGRRFQTVSRAKSAAPSDDARQQMAFEPHVRSSAH